MDRQRVPTLKNCRSVAPGVCAIADRGSGSPHRVRELSFGVPDELAGLHVNPIANSFFVLVGIDMKDLQLSLRQMCLRRDDPEKKGA